MKSPGINLISDKKIKFSVDHVKIIFFRAFNCVYSRSKGANSELVAVELLKSYCLPGLLYAVEEISLTAASVHILDNCINRALYKIFGACDSDSFKQVWITECVCIS